MLKSINVFCKYFLVINALKKTTGSSPFFKITSRQGGSYQNDPDI